MSAKEPPKTDHERRRGTSNADGELFTDGVYPLLERRTVQIFRFRRGG
jgi:hypothetical protein